MEKYPFVLVLITALSQTLGDSKIKPQKIPLQILPSITSRNIVLNSISKLSVGNGVERIQNVQDLYYIGVITSGNPAQSLSVMFDTTGGDSWMTSSRFCVARPRYCEAHGTYDHLRSSSYKKVSDVYNYTYTIGMIKGFLVQDDVSMGNLKVEGQVFGEITKGPSLFTQLPFDGVLGLSFGREFIQADTFITNLFNQNSELQPVFALYISKDEVSPFGGGGSGEITLGGVNYQHFTGDFHYTPVISHHNWIVKLDRINVCKWQVAGTMAALLSTSTTSIIGPESIISIIHKSINATRRPDGLFYLDCNNLKEVPTVAFVIGKRHFPMRPEDYIVKVDDPNTGEQLCSTAFEVNDNINFVVLGYKFLRLSYTLFDLENRRVGFADLFKFE